MKIKKMYFKIKPLQKLVLDTAMIWSILTVRNAYTQNTTVRGGGDARACTSYFGAVSKNRSDLGGSRRP